MKSLGSARVVTETDDRDGATEIAACFYAFVRALPTQVTETQCFCPQRHECRSRVSVLTTTFTICIQNVPNLWGFQHSSFLISRQALKNASVIMQILMPFVAMTQWLPYVSVNRAQRSVFVLLMG